MAEGGQERDGDNPFSFKSFVTKKDKRKEDDDKPSSSDEIDIFAIPDASAQRKRDKPKQIVVVDENDGSKDTQKQKKGKSENPFSFKKFLSGSNNKNTEKQKLNQAPVTDEQRLSGDLHDTPNLHVAGDLPDFVQDHYSDTHLGSPRGLELPDFALRGVSQNVPDIGDSNFPNLMTDNDSVQRQPGLSSGTHSNGNHSDFDEISDNEESIPQQAVLVNSLPDFLSDAAVSSSKNTEKSTNSIPIVSNISDFQSPEFPRNSELQQLQEENARLRRQIEELQVKRSQDAERISEVERQLVEQKMKEHEETAVMERAMEQVEQNLSATTKRAVLAESTVSKLKLEVKALQTEIKALRGENGLLSSDQHLNEVKERTNYVAEQLSTATKTAETSLRQLLSGVDNLKLLSQVLESIDKISEESTSTDNKNET